MNKDKIIKTINKIDSLFQIIKNELEVKQENGDDKVSVKENNVNRSKKKTGITSSLTYLISKGYMDEYKTAIDLTKEFKKQALNYEPDSIRTALMRLVQKGVLEREGEGTHKNPWKYKKIK